MLFQVAGETGLKGLLTQLIAAVGGVDKDTQKECSTRGGGPGYVNISTGPSAGMYERGHCGHSCENSLADDVGMIEYDLVNESIVGCPSRPSPT